MTAKHQRPEYRRNAKTLRRRVLAMHARGEAVPCWRGRGAILPGQPFDIGHKHPAGGEGFDNLAAEHRTRQPGCCAGNRSAGGAIGAAITNRRRRPTDNEVTSWAL